MIGTVICAGCASAPRASVPSASSTHEVLSSTATVTEALTGQKFNDEQLKALGRRIQNDKEARSAAQAVTQSLGALQPGIKYCPVDGKRFSDTLTTCPDHKVPLRTLDE